MNDFIRKYRWTLILVAAGVAVALTYYNRQETETVVAVEEEAPMVEVVEQEETPAAEPVAEVVEPEPVSEPAEEPVAEVVEPEPVSEPAEEPVAEVVEPEPVSEPAEEPVVEVVEPEPAEESVAKVAEEPVGEPTEESAVEPEPETVEVAPEVSEPEVLVVEEPVEEAAPLVEEEPEATTEAAETTKSEPEAEPEIASEPEMEVTQEPVVVTEPAVEPEIEVTEEPVTESEPAPEPAVEAIEQPGSEPEPTAEPAQVEPVIEPVVEEKSVVEEDSEPDQEPAVPSVEETTTESTEETTMVEEVAEAITTPEVAQTEDVIKPSFDVVRVDATGSAVIAGSAEPFSKVVILSNGEDIGEAIADSSGEFVAIIQVPENEQGQTLELETEISGQLVFSDEAIIILPILRSRAAETVTEESAPPIIRATAGEVVIIQGGAQLSLGRVSLDSISYDENDEVVLAGRGNPGRTIIIYVDDRPLTDAVVSESGSWKQALHGLDAGRYVLRVDEIDDDGNVTSRVESPFQREYPEDVREAKAQNNTTYTVQPGNSLWIIATGRYGDGMQYHQIFAANHHQIRDPDLIYPGQIFALPDTEE